MHAGRQITQDRECGYEEPPTVAGRLTGARARLRFAVSPDIDSSPDHEESP
jgi:hypothetical protein